MEYQWNQRLRSAFHRAEGAVSNRMMPVDKDKKPTPPAGANSPDEELVYDSAVDEFFRRLNYDMRRPKPGQEGITAALQAIQRLALEGDASESAEIVSAHSAETQSNLCPMCGARNRPENRFCAGCGVSLQALPAEDLVGNTGDSSPQPPSTPAGPHSYHHHYHHHYFANVEGGGPSAPEARAAGNGAAAREVAKGRPPGPGQASGRAEAAVRKLTQDWALACNTKHLDDLVDLYAPDAVVLRSNVPTVRGTAAIREFFFTVLEAGLSEAELEPLRVELLGEVAFEAGRCKTLVPVAMGKRREERGKYLMVSVRLKGEWKLIADCWSSDLSLQMGAKP
jgi:uncharacterized protein (TIGR02246 family)